MLYAAVRRRDGETLNFNRSLQWYCRLGLPDNIITVIISYIDRMSDADPRQSRVRDLARLR